VTEQQSDEQQRWGHDHICHTTVKFAGDPRQGFWWLEVIFGGSSEIDELIRLLTDLRNNPGAQGHHIHLQDSRFCDEHPEHGCMAPEDGEIVFRSPQYEHTEVDLELLQDGSEAMRAFYRPPKPVHIAGLENPSRRRSSRTR